MSLEGIGVVVAAPVVAGAAVAAVAAVAAAAAVAGAGYLVAREGSKAVIACGKELRDMAAENLKMQQAIRDSARKYEQELQNAARLQSQQRAEQARIQLEQYRSQQARRAKELEAMRRLVHVPRTAQIDWAAVENARAKVMTETKPQADSVKLISGWPHQISDLQTFVAKLVERLSIFTSGYNAHLFKTDGLVWLLQEIESHLQTLESSSIRVALKTVSLPITDYEQVLAAALYLERQIKEMELLTPERIKQHLAAVDAIYQVRVELQDLLEDYESSEIEGIGHVTRMLDDADEALNEAEFARAIAGAEAVSKHLANLSEVGQALRRRNLEALIETWDVRMQPLEELQPLRAEVGLWFKERDIVCALLQQDVAAAWQRADSRGGLLKEAEHIIERAGIILLQSTAEMLGHTAQECMSEMGYSVTTEAADNGMRTLLGRNELGQRIAVTISDQGTMAFKLAGHDDDSCKPALAEFMTRLKDKGVGIAYQTDFSLGEATDTLVRILQGAGFDDVWVEPSEDGVSIMVSGEPDLTAMAGYDGASKVSKELHRLWIEHVEGQKPAPVGPKAQENPWMRAQQEFREMQKYRLREVAR